MELFAAAAGAGVFVGVVVAVAPGLAVGGAAPPDLSKYLSNAALAFPGVPNGVLVFALSSALSFIPAILSLLAERALCISRLAVDILLDVDCLLCTEAELISDPEPNSRSSLIFLSFVLVMLLSFPRSPLLFFLSPGNISLCVDCIDSLDPVDRRSTLVSLSSLLMVMALYVSLEYPDSDPPRVLLVLTGIGNGIEALEAKLSLLPTDSLLCHMFAFSAIPSPIDTAFL